MAATLYLGRFFSLPVLTITLFISSGVKTANAQEVSSAPEPPVVTPESAPKKASSPRRKFHLKIGPEYSVYRPNTAKVANRFGSSWMVLGLDFGDINSPKVGLRFYANSKFWIGKSGDNRVYLAPLQAGVMQDWKLGRTSVYLGLTGGPCGVNLRADPEGVKAGWRFTPSGTLTAGANLSRRAYIEAQYYRMSPVRGFDFSGSSLATGFRF